MKIGDSIEVRNLNSQADERGAWARAKVTGMHGDFDRNGILFATVDHPGHAMHGKQLTVGAPYYRPVPPSAK